MAKNKRLNEFFTSCSIVRRIFTEDLSRLPRITAEKCMFKHTVYNMNFTYNKNTFCKVYRVAMLPKLYFTTSGNILKTLRQFLYA